MASEVISHYGILEKPGAGGMGEVYRAHDERLDRDVALKVLKAGTLVDEPTRRRFRKEALTLSQLNHPHIATVFEFDAEYGVDFLAMEFVTGSAHALAGTGSAPSADGEGKAPALSVVSQFARGSGEFTSPRGGIKPPLHQIETLPSER